MSPLRVLLIEDSTTDAKLVLHELKKLGKPLDSARVDNEAELREALKRSWDLILCDWSMPRFSARAALAVVRGLGIELPFVIVSGTVGEESAVEAMRAGAHDYVLKNNLGRLVPAVERELREAEARVERKRTETALRMSEARFARLANSGIVGIVFADLHGNVFDANDAYLAIVGFSREDLAAGRINWNELVPPEWRHDTDRAVTEIRATGATPPREQELFRKDGRRVPVLMGAALLDDPEIVGFVIDRTRQKRAERAEAKRAEEARLEHAGRERAEEALRRSEEQLRHAQKMEAVGRLAGGVAHDFNNVLSIILSYAEVLMENFRAGDPIRADLDEIRKVALRASGLTRQLLLFSRQQVTTPKVVDLNDIVVNMEKMLNRVLGEDIDLAFRLEQALGRIRVDPGHIEQVVMNLAVNARDAMPRGGKLTIETTNVVLDESYAESHLPMAPGTYVMLAVTDTGAGMESAVKARIFEPFFTTKARGKGTGLGLSTVFGIVQQAGGGIWVYSEVDIGTTFKIYLPLVHAAVDVTRPSAAPTKLEGDETVLLVEDEEQVRAVVLAVLRRYGYRVLPAADTHDAIALCDRHPGPIDLLLTDVVMPQMSGPELAKLVAGSRPNMKILYMSGYTDDSIARHGVIDTSVAYLQKPFTPVSLATKVREALEDGRD
jgi:PAS domain S-box-containing protein